VGKSETDVGVGRAFLWRNGKLTDMGTLGGRTSNPTAINDQGEIVGQSDTRLGAYSAPHGPRPFFWKNGTMVELPTRKPEPTNARPRTRAGGEGEPVLAGRCVGGDRRDEKGDSRLMARSCGRGCGGLSDR
jgi:probable HAF family extracellular repeat protein